MAQTTSRFEEAYVRLARTSALAQTPGIVIAERDLPSLDEVSGSRTRSHELIAALESAGRLRGVRRGAYVLVDQTGVVRADVLDLIDALTPRPYLVTAGRALQFHDLTDQHFRRVQVSVRTQLRPWSWRGDIVRFSRTSRSLRGNTTRTRKTRAAIATPERAIADSLAHPAWGVTLSQVAEALDRALQRDPGFADKLAVEVAHDHGYAPARRIGFLVSRLASDDIARAFLPLRGKSKAATPLLAGGPRTGSIDSQWNVRENVEIERLMQHREVM